MGRLMECETILTVERKERESVESELQEVIRVLRKEKNDMAKAFLNLKKKYEITLQTVKELQDHPSPLSTPPSPSSSPSISSPSPSSSDLAEQNAKLREILRKANERIQSQKSRIRLLEEQMEEERIGLPTTPDVNSEFTDRESRAREREAMREAEEKWRSRLSAAEESLKQAERERDTLQKERERERESLVKERDALREEFESYRLKAHGALQHNAAELSRVSEMEETLSHLRQEVAQLKQVCLCVCVFVCL